MRAAFKLLFSLHSVSLTVGGIILAALLMLLEAPFFDSIELRTYDFRVKSRPVAQPSSAVVLALIDEKSLDTEGRWPWPRSRMAALVDRLSQDGAKVIAFDVGFLEPDENSQLRLIDQFDQKIDALALDNPELRMFIAQRRQYADNDLALANAIKRSSAAVVLGYFFHMQQGNDKDKFVYRLDQNTIDQQLKRISASKYPLVLYENPEMQEHLFLTAYAPESNLDMLTEVAAASGYFTLSADPDGAVRWMPLMIQGGEDLFPPLPVAAAWHYLEKPQLMVKVGSHGVDGIQMGRRFIPTDNRGRLLLNFLGPPQTFPHISISDILQGKTPKGTFNDKIVLIGATATGTSDMRNTPVSAVYPGVEIHATVIDNILTQDFLIKPSWSTIYDLFAILVLGVLMGLVLPRMSAFKGLCFTAGLFALHIVVARWLFVNAGVWINVVYPLLALVTNYTTLTLHDYISEERERKKITGAFGQYVSPVVINEMLKDPARLQLGGEEKVLTVLFSDLQGFTAASERFTPHEMIDLLSDYYARMTEQIFEQEGMLKEYVGDELMAIFGAPVEQQDHAARACAAALAMRDQRAALRAEWAQVGRPPLNARTGVNSGLMLVGNLGSKYRFAYGVLGDHVNLGSRLEGLNKQYKTEILIGENTADLVGNTFLLREVDMVQVVGRQQSVRLYELLAKAGQWLPPEQEKALKSYAAGLQAYRQQYWGDALSLFQESLLLCKGDGPSQVMIERCLMYQESPPPENWDGVYVATSK
ncbi:MAG: adenylate/guanylate cyclase domain-containing protein [bacterium]|nr:adenylate/guanylate cyclase domain-containing protein [bacterium]